MQDVTKIKLRNQAKSLLSVLEFNEYMTYNYVNWFNTVFTIPVTRTWECFYNIIVRDEKRVWTEIIRNELIGPFGNIFFSFKNCNEANIFVKKKCLKLNTRIVSVVNQYPLWTTRINIYPINFSWYKWKANVFTLGLRPWNSCTKYKDYNYVKIMCRNNLVL